MTKGKTSMSGTQEKYQMLPELPPERYAALKADIAERGVVVPVVVDEFGITIDGHNRVRACRELGINDYPIETRAGLTESEKRSLARKLNALRRHLSREQVRVLIGDQLRDTPDWTDRKIAAEFGVSPTTVGDVRRQISAMDGTVQIGQLGKKRVGRDGKTRRVPTQKPRDLEHGADEDNIDDEEALQRESTRNPNAKRAALKADRQWEEALGLQCGELATKRAKLEHAVDLIAMGADPNGEKVTNLIREASARTFRSPGYNPFAGRSEEEEREWHLFVLFLVLNIGWPLANAATHVEWLLQRPFQNVAEWMGADAWREVQRMRPFENKLRENWKVFVEENKNRSKAEIVHELELKNQERIPT
jgi:ParB-like chromosome segregation protein Spo0J